MALSPLVLKIILLIVQVALSVAFGLAPVKVLKVLRKRASSSTDVMRSKWPSLILCLLSCFTGGVFLATCFLHLLPEVTEHMVQIRKTNHIHSDYPIGELLSCAGFFLVFFIEELVILCVKRHGGGVQHGPNVLHVHVAHNNSSSNENNGGVAELVPVDGANGHRHSDVQCVHVAVADGVKEEEKPISELSPLDMCRSHSPCLEPCAEGFTVPSRAEPECCEVGCEAQKEDPPVPVTFKPHAHHHGVRSITLLLALSLHSVIEGLAFGIQSTTDKAVALFLSIIFHKCIVAFSTGLQLARTHPHQIHLVVISIISFALMSPLGSTIGIVVEQASLETGAKEIVVMVFEAISVGTFLYVTFFEVFIHERDNDHPAMLKLLVSVIGFGLIAVVRTMEHSHDGHDGE